MTSQTDLPLVPAGIIWDGVTQYQNVVPLGVRPVWLLRMVGDGTRQFTEFRATETPATQLVQYQTDFGWANIGITFDSPVVLLRDNPVVYLDYDGSLSLLPVNQIPWLRLFKGHAARLMHQLDATIGHHSLQAAEEVDRETIRQTIRDMIGAAWIKYQVWAVIDPEELIVGGNNDGVPLWKHGLATEQDRDEAICGQCNFSNFARLCLTDMNIPIFRRLLRSGIVYSVNIATRPKWEPAIFDIATNPRSQYYDLLEAGALAARRYYDTVVGVQDIG